MMALRICVGIFFALICSITWAEDEFDRPPISYSTSASRDPVALWLDRLSSGAESLIKDEHGSYLRAVLRALDIPESSQCLVFSKTSMQISYIGPQTPRAIYFNDTVYVGSVVGSPIIELTECRSTVRLRILHIGTSGE